MPLRDAYIVAARRTAIGRPGGLHRHRRIEDLTAPLVTEVLKDARLSAAQVEGLILGNTSAGGNPARLVALAAGLPEIAPASTIDQQCASGLEAIVTAIRWIRLGEAEVLLAGGAEALSMAPWRIAKPRSVHLTPHFIDTVALAGGEDSAPEAAEVGDDLATRLKISRHQQDDYALRSHIKAGLAGDAKRFLKEIVPLKANADEARDQSAVEPELQDLQDAAPFNAKGSLTAANTSTAHDGAAIVAVVSEAVWSSLGKPPALKLVAHVTVGAEAHEAGEVAQFALRRVATRIASFDPAKLELVEMSEASAVEAIALRNAFGIGDAALNPDGGAIARGHPLAAASAVLVVRLFTRMARASPADAPACGAAVSSALGAQATAAIFVRA